MVTAASKAFGRVDALINNAALWRPPGGRFETITEADWDAAMTVNVEGHLEVVASRWCRRCARPAEAASSVSPHWPRRSGRRLFYSDLKGRRDRHDAGTRS